MTKRGHFILNGAARVIVNQILRSPGIYYQQKIYENYDTKKKGIINYNIMVLKFKWFKKCWKF